MEKKLFLVVLTMLTFFIGKAQDYIPMLDRLNEWKFTTCNSGCITDTYYTNGDTLVDGITYKVLDGFHYISRTFLLREDVTEKKVYTRIFLPDREINHLLYDFSLEVGDSFEMFNPVTPFPNGGGMFDLIAIESLPLADGNEYRHFYFSPSAGNTTSTQDAVWVEGVGSLSIVTAPGGHPDINDVGHLSCAFKNGVRVYENLESITKCAPTILGVQDTKSPLWNVQFYNVEDAVRIINATEVKKISVFSITGSKVAEVSNTLNKSEFSIPTGKLTQGVYILKASDSEGHLKTFKCIVN